MKTSMARGWIALCLGLLVLCSGCGRTPEPGEAVLDEDVPAMAATAAASPGQQLLVDLEGVWSTRENEGTDDSEDVYVLWLEDGVLRVFRDQGGMAEWTVNVDDIDADNGIVTLQHSTQGLEEIVTFRKVVVDAQEGEGHRLTVTHGNGQRSLLGFVRRVSPADLRKIEDIRRDERASADAGNDSGEAALDCEAPSGWRETQVCKDTELRDKHRDLMLSFSMLRDRGRADIQSTEMAARRQLDACTTRQCLADAYAQWVDYINTNYPELFVE